ncbi:MAG TPA: beta-ketoacyl synthase N-terminal-like domain-containing protein [Labilithrix sp.]|nr:beta-ketoacyl synthase N-terminal-like domain-containing protein [Labilithrix sp.]
MTPRYVTGLGIACALGTGAETFFRGLADASRLSALPPSVITSFDASKYPDARVVEVPGFDPTKYLGDKGLRTLDRLTKLLVVAARLCLHDAGFKKDGEWIALSPERVGVCCSNAYGSLEAITELDRVAQLEDARYINPAKFPNTVSNSASGYVSIWEDLRALNVSVSDGNCGGLDAVGCADVFLETARADAIITGGGEAMSEPIFLAFQKLGVLGPVSPLLPAPEAGMVAARLATNDTRLGEGAAFLALEDPDVATARGARVLGMVTGYGTAFVAAEEHALVFASREAMIRAITSALADAAIQPQDVDLVVSSVAGLARFDIEELAAIAAVLGEAPVVAPKLALGETLGAGGAMAMAASLAWLGGAAVPGALVVRGVTPSAVRTVVVTTIGYYGNASAVVMRGPGEAAKTR